MGLPPDTPIGRGQFWGKAATIVSLGTFCRELCKNGQSDRFAVGIVVLVDSDGPKEAHGRFSRIRQAAPMCRHGKVHWRHLSNTMEPSVCGGDAVLCQFPLTACFSVGCCQVSVVAEKCPER